MSGRRTIPAACAFKERECVNRQGAEDAEKRMRFGVAMAESAPDPKRGLSLAHKCDRLAPFTWRATTRRSRVPTTAPRHASWTLGVRDVACSRRPGLQQGNSEHVRRRRRRARREHVVEHRRRVEHDGRWRCWADGNHDDERDDLRRRVEHEHWNGFEQHERSNDHGHGERRWMHAAVGVHRDTHRGAPLW